MNSQQFGLGNKDMDAIVKSLSIFKNIEEAVLFGSRAKGNYKRGSDVDIAIKGNVDLKTVSKLSHILNQKTLMPYKFDIVSYATMKQKSLKEHIDRVGILIYS